MARPRPPSIAWPLTGGILLIVACVALAALWNVVLVTDTLHLRELTAGRGGTEAGRWILLIIGSALFLGVLVGLTLFLVTLIRQIRLSRAQQNFIDSVTHELKTPLTSLKLHLQTLQRGKVEPERAQEFHGVMLQDVERLERLLDHVLEAARLERRAAIPLQPVPLRPLLESVARTIRVRHGLDEGAIALSGEGTVRAEPSSLELVFLNLLDNAVKYTPDASPVEVAIAPPSDGRIAVRVRDHGVGLAPRERKRIFQRFYRVGNELERTRPGAGLGLYLVHETLKGLGGKIMVESPGLKQGSTFVVTLPGG